MPPDMGLLMLLEGGAVDGDEVCRRRRRRGGHRVGGVHPSADSQTDLEGVQLCHNAEFEVLLLLLLALLLARSLFTRNSAPSLGVGGARKYAGSCCSHSTCSLAPSFLACSPSFSAVYLFPARTLTRHSAAAAASTHFGLTCHFFTLSLSSSLSCSCSSSSSFARTPSCYVLWEFGYPPRWLQSEIEWMDRIIDGLLNFQDCHSA